MDELPFIDEHAVTVQAIPVVAWEAVYAVVEASLATPRAARVARVLGCEPSGPSDGTIRYGGTLPGFAVVPSRRPAPLVLAGRHRFARYRLTFAVEALGGGRSHVTASTHAAFPGGAGRAYRALVIGSRGHVLAVRRMLAAVRRHAAANADRRIAFEEECLRRVRLGLADDATLRGEMEGHGRSLRSLTLERTADDAEIVADMVLADGTPLTERYSVWHHDTPPNLREPEAAREAASMIVVGITGL